VDDFDWNLGGAREREGAALVVMVVVVAVVVAMVVTVVRVGFGRQA
jgi:hypothetical protein